MKFQLSADTQPAPMSALEMNAAAREEVHRLMNNREYLSMYPDVEGEWPAMKVCTNHVERFCYVMEGQDDFQELMNYLKGQPYQRKMTDPHDESVKQPEGTTSNDFRKDLLRKFIESGVARTLQFTPMFRQTRPNRVTATASFRNGRIFFFVDADDDFIDYLRAKNLL